MLNQLGSLIRTSRKQKGIPLNEFAEKLGVSAGYLSNLETGKTDTISLSLLEKLQEELNLLPIKDTEDADNDEFRYRLQKVSRLLIQLNRENPDEAEYLLSFVEKGIELFNKKH
jgi:transcriptional regulator with XRE-family HTH domain